MTTTSLRKVDQQEHQLLKDICLEYICELMPPEKVHVGKIHELMDRYFAEEDRHPYFIFADGMLCGFVLVNSCCALRRSNLELVVNAVSSSLL
ncbi:MAG: hypothetical protein JWO03_647 [Bacteroidetes bacterium]|nr:hypothetical protein [Bacteroidota bacterium]